ncbi:MAG: hypothetical protein JRI26_11435 [Deltaproteobacteria bacterium]|nr:hypothetical protein [Deltaproteobacteria bacterium]
MKKCAYCKDPILKFQKFVTRLDREGKKKYYHAGCHEIILDKIVDKVRKA